MPELPPRKVGVNYRRQVSDGNYGTEAAEVSLEWWVEYDDDGQYDQEVAQAMLRQAHEVVHAQLRNSQNISVRKATLPLSGKTAPARTAATVPTDDENPF